MRHNRAFWSSGGGEVLIHAWDAQFPAPLQRSNRRTMEPDCTHDAQAEDLGPTSVRLVSRAQRVVLPIAHEVCLAFDAAGLSTLAYDLWIPAMLDGCRIDGPDTGFSPRVGAFEQRAKDCPQCGGHRQSNGQNTGRCRTRLPRREKTVATQASCHRRWDGADLGSGDCTVLGPGSGRRALRAGASAPHVIAIAQTLGRRSLCGSTRAMGFHIAQQPSDPFRNRFAQARTKEFPRPAQTMGGRTDFRLAREMSPSALRLRTAPKTQPHLDHSGKVRSLAAKPEIGL